MFHFNFHVNVVGTDLAHRRLSHNDLMNINRSIKLDLTSPHSIINPGDNFHFKLTTNWSCLAFYGCFSVNVIASVSLSRDINTVYGLIGSIIKHIWERYGKRKFSCFSCLCLIFRLWWLGNSVCRSITNILKVKIVKNLSLFLHQFTFAMHRPKVYSNSK